MRRKFFNGDLRQDKFFNFEGRKLLSGRLIFLAVLASMIGLIIYPPLTAVAGFLYFINCALLWQEISHSSKLLIKVIVLASAPVLCLALIAGKWNVFFNLFASNAPIISLMVAVSTYSLLRGKVASNDIATSKKTGVLGFLYLFFGLHLLGAVINYAAALFYGDRLKNENGLSVENTVLISRCFASAGFWSPFFVTMAVAFNYSPDANYVSVVKYTVLLAIASFMYCLLNFMANPESAKFQGIAISLADFYVPILMAVIILILIGLFPDLSVIGIVISICVFFYLWKSVRNEKIHPIDKVTNGFSGFSGECGIFLAAAALNSSLLYGVQDLGTHFSAIALSAPVLAIFVTVSVVLTCIGIHPLISISVFTGIITITPGLENALAFSLVASWAIGSSLGPMSGQNLGLASRYGVDSKIITKFNLPYSTLLCLLAIALLIIVPLW